MEDVASSAKAGLETNISSDYNSKQVNLQNLQTFGDRKCYIAYLLTLVPDNVSFMSAKMFEQFAHRRRSIPLVSIRPFNPPIVRRFSRPLLV